VCVALDALFNTSEVWFSERVSWTG
jgi:hypothetical protein